MLSLAASASLTAAPQRSGQATDARTRDIYVSVVDEKGNAVTGLSAADFAVREDGVAREVLRAVPADEPLEVIVLVDDSQAATTAIPFIRDGLSAFADRLRDKAAIGLVTIGERPTSVVERTTDTQAVKKGITRIFARPGAGAYLLEGILEVTRGFQKRETRRPVIVALTVEGVEFSNQQYDRVLKALHASGATFHALVIGTPAGGLSDEQRQRHLVLAEGTAQTGGRREQLLTDMAIPGALAKLADELLNQYRVTYARPDALVPPEKIQVSVTRPGATARSRTMAPGR
ncbi:MAG TPA: hypothetical protein VM364_18110 [Vicinamibacterales bacterium]|nr:hypothetical protein [Vicinamibacterales bacterium]